MTKEYETSRTTDSRRLKIGLLGLSDPAPWPGELIQALDFCDVHVSPILSRPSAGDARAAVWNDWMRQGDFDWIFDVSGGNLSTLALPFLDLELYGACRTLFAGYSDLTPVLNALTAATGKETLLFSASQNIPALCAFLKEGDPALVRPDWHALGSMRLQDLVQAPVAGGNIRCLLKLAGTPWWPDLTARVLFLEARSGNAMAIASMVAQLCNMGVMDQIRALALGQFTELQDPLPVVLTVLEQMGARIDLPVLLTSEVGHAPGSKGLWIGKELFS
ncbi:LD-carboxypeptidase [Faecalibaculum rodentium]|uniref:LD-carboxypeptidase n=1 Tax=Faecalibaculum rodentium TaxID=1702221 RepID=UPI0023F3242C|nr:LD-carboxypeptidase [Faecalibaculum rodentium]